MTQILIVLLLLLEKLLELGLLLSEKYIDFLRVIEHSRRLNDFSKVKLRKGIVLGACTNTHFLLPLRELLQKSLVPLHMEDELQISLHRNVNVKRALPRSSR